MNEIDSPLQRAQQHLRIADVYMRSSAVGVASSYEHRTVDPDALQSQFRHFIEKSEVLVDNDGEQALFRVFVDLGYRWGVSIDKRLDSESQVNESDELEFEELGRIEAKYVAEYEIADELSQECLDAFALKNASYHVWPYWREYVTSSCARMNVPKLVMPTIQLAQNSGTSSTDEP